MHRFILESSSPEFTPPEALQELANALRDPELETKVLVVPTQPTRGYAVTPWEVLHFWAPWETLDDAATLWLMGKIFTWMKARRQQAKQEDEERAQENPNVWRSIRPTAVIIYGPDGKALKEIELQSPHEEPIVREPRDPDRRRIPPTLDT